ncbi:hypothetical protein Pla8534_15300 [Lignipirellula cremea]|uniref:Uncharacterized protein n=1 Tax=Lignipirellula cremea TaxID=2528010 RepID=A0A518DPH3_9BACT|nr:hypothetical protein Pla8534_15300 [Lignipirellula cremea]
MGINVSPSETHQMAWAAKNPESFEAVIIIGFLSGNFRPHRIGSVDFPCENDRMPDSDTQPEIRHPFFQGGRVGV